MPTAQPQYFGTYCRLVSTSGDSGIKVDGNSWPVGYELEMTPQLHITERGKEVPRVVVGKGGKAAGFVAPEDFERLQPLMDEGWVCRAFTSVIGFDKLKDMYWVEVALMCYPLDLKEAFDPFVAKMAARIGKGEHPAVRLSQKEIAHVIESKGTWADTKKDPLPKLKKGRAYYKTKQTFTENMAQQAASGNKGCYVGLVAFTVIVVAIIVAVVLL